jgi:hypothetical protein
MMSESELITLGWRYELAKPERAKAIRQEFKNTLEELSSADLRSWFIHLFEQGRQEARRS